MGTKSAPNRPDTVPAAAVWNPKENEWEFGAKNAEGKEIGPWIWWAPEGFLVCKCDYDDNGGLHGRLERWHANGEIAQWADWIHGKTHGMQVWTKATSGKSDKNSALPPHLGDDVVRMDMPYDQGRPQVYHFTLYNAKGLKNGVPCDADGRSIDLGVHLARVASETTLHLLTRSFATVDGNQVLSPSDDSARWIFHGPKGANWKVSLIQSSKSTYVVSSQEMSRAFTLSADFYLASIRAKRPETVAEEAVWNIRDETWELGTMEKARPVGPWKVWDKKGRVRKTMNYTRYGALHGPVEHNYTDGTPEFRATYFKGDLVGAAVHTRCAAKRSEGFIEVDHKVWRCESEIQDGRERRKYFLHNGSQCNKFGVSIEDAYRDSLFLENSAANFLDSGFSAFLETVRVDDSKITDEVNTAGWADFWGQEMHSDLSGFLQVMFKNQSPVLTSLVFNKHAFWGEFEDSIENRIRVAQESPTSTRLHEVFAGAVLLGKSEAEEIYLVSTCDHGATPRVFVFDRTTREIKNLFAKDLNHFAYLISARDASARDAISPEAMEHVWTQVTGAWTPWGPWLAHAPEVQALDQKDVVIAMASASEWIIDLLQGHTPLDDIARNIKLDEWPRLDEANWEQHLERARTDVPFGLHVLWRLFFCKKDYELEEFIVACAKSPARILRDAAAQLQEIQWGEEGVGKIEDIYELREEFWRLGVLPESTEEAAPDDEPSAEPRTPAFRKLLSGIAWCKEPERFWSIAMSADQVDAQQRKEALKQIIKLEYLGNTLMPVVRFAAKRLGGNVSDVRQHVRTALHKEMNPPTLEAGRTQIIWALRVAGEDDSIELEVIAPWCHYDDETIRAAAIEAMGKRVPEYEIPEFWGDEVRALIALGDRKSASRVLEYVERMLEDWIPYAKQAPTPEILDTMMASLAQFKDEPAWVAAAKKCLDHSENVIIQAALRAAPPHDSSLLDLMAKNEETQTGWARRVARGWLELYPDQDAANKARDL